MRELAHMHLLANQNSALGIIYLENNRHRALPLHPFTIFRACCMHAARIAITYAVLFSIHANTQAHHLNIVHMNKINR